MSKINKNLKKNQNQIYAQQNNNSIKETNSFSDLYSLADKLNDYKNKIDAKLTSITDDISKIKKENESLKTELMNIKNDIKTILQHLEAINNTTTSMYNGYISNILVQNKKTIIDNIIDIKNSLITSFKEQFKTFLGKENLNNDIENIVTSLKPINDIKKVLNDEILENTEITEGKIKVIEKTITDIEQILKDKNIVIQQKIPAFNQDDKAIDTMVEYANKIIEKISIAGRQYALNKEKLNSIDEERKRYNIEKEEEKNKALQQGRIDGVKTILKDFITKKNDLYSLSKDDNNTSKIMFSILENNGLETKYTVGENINITRENIEEYRDYIDSPLNIGKIKIKKPAYLFYGEIVSKAEYETIDESKNSSSYTAEYKSKDKSKEILKDDELALNKSEEIDTNNKSDK